jgi:hypothetical protein
MIDLPRTKGKRPTFVDPAVDDLVAMVMAVAQELAVLRERCDTYERLLLDKNILSEAEIEGYAPSVFVETSREQWRRDYLDRILWIVKARATEAAKG